LKVKIMTTLSESTPYTLARFVDDFKAIAVNNSDIHDVLKRLTPLAELLAACTDLKARVHKDCDPVQGFSFQVLHEEADHTLAVAVLSWLPGRGTPPHDHGTWGLVVGVEGDEVNEFWKRTDDGSQSGRAELLKLSEKVFAPGQTLLLTPSIIHSVRNDSDQISVSLHIYGKNVNFTNRSRFDPEQKTVTPWLVTQS
jgi:predicted metal-dependent enzyme (double-stranded beta helix superfamily)